MALNTAIFNWILSSKNHLKVVLEYLGGTLSNQTTKGELAYNFSYQES